MIRKFLLPIIIILSLCSSFSFAQVQGTQPHEIKWMSVGALRQWFSNSGSEIEYGRRGRAGFVNVDQLDGLIWPSEYTQNKGVMASKALWIGTTNFADPFTGKTYPYKIVSSGPRLVNLGTEMIVKDFSMIGKFDHPSVFVDNALSSYRDNDDVVDEIDESLPADRAINNVIHTTIGLTITRKVLAFSQQYHDNYYIYEYTFTNTGIIDESGEQKLTKTLTDVVPYIQWRLGYAGESYLPTGAWAPSGASWGRNTINDAIGIDGNHPGDFRAVWSYYGPHASTLFGTVEGDIGLPGPNQNNVSILAGAQFSGAVVLHADKSTSDKSDDKSQPSTTLFVGTDNSVNGVDQFSESLNSRKYLDVMTAGHPAQTHAEQIGKDPVTGFPTAFANTWGSDAGGYASSMGFGPYDIAPGESIKIVVAEAVAAIDREKNREVASTWFKQTGPYVLPNGSTTTDRNVYKNTWVFSGRDSLFQTFRRAIENYKSNYAIPQPPPPPDQFIVNSGGNKIMLSWSNTAESHPNFDGYRLFRAEGRTDTTFDMIFECSKSNVVNSFDDKSAKRGFNYYYYVQSKDDGSTNNIQPGIPLVSSKYYTMTYNPAYLTRPAGAALTTVTTFEDVPVNPVLTITEDVDEDSLNDVVTNVSYNVVLEKSTLDSIGTVVRGVSAYSNGSRIIPASVSLSNDTLYFAYLPGVKIELPSTREKVSNALASILPGVNINVSVISPVNPQVDALLIGDDTTKTFTLPEPVEDGNGNKLYTVQLIGSDGEISSSAYTLTKDLVTFMQAPADGDTIAVMMKSQKQRDYKLSQIRIVPNPYNLKARNIQNGLSDNTTLDRISFYNLPPVCKIRIFTETGDLVETIEHINGSGDDFWNSLTSSRQLVVSGLYIAHFEVTEDAVDDVTKEVIYRKGDSIFKKFIIIR